MLSPADAALVARDPAITGLGVLLDPEAFAAALRSALPASGVGAVEPLYARYKPGTSCLVHYRVEAAAGPTTAYAHAYAAELRPKLHYARRLRDRAGALGPGGLTLEELDIAICCWPHDHDLPALRRLDDQGRRARLLAEACPARPDLAAAALVSLRHRPRRRFVARLAGAVRGDAVIKLYCADDCAPARAAAGAFRSAGPLRVGGPAGCSDEHRALVFPWQQGEPLAALLGCERRGPAAVGQAGAALAELHRQPAPGLPAGGGGPGGELAAAARAVAALCPELAAPVARLARDLAAALGGPPAPRRPLHGDFYADQVLVGPGHATLLDFDNAHWGEPAADLGNFLAHLRRGAALGQGAGPRPAALAAALWDGYGSGAALPARGRVGAHAALGLLRLAPEPFRRRAPHWPAQVQAIVGAAERALSEGLGC